MTSLVPPLLVVHVGLALALVLPALLLPLALRPSRDSAPTDRAPTGRLASGLIALQSRGSAPIGLGVLASGLALLAAVGLELLGEPWLLVALAIYAVNLAVAWFIQLPGLRRLIGRSEASNRALARRLRWVSYGMAAMVGAIGFLMSTKPDLW
jgi:hypothetical protein